MLVLLQLVQQGAQLFVQRNVKGLQVSTVQLRPKRSHAEEKRRLQVSHVFEQAAEVVLATRKAQLTYKDSDTHTDKDKE